MHWCWFRALVILVPAIPDNNVTIAVVLVMMSVATTTVVGIEKGLAWLSRINLRLLYALLLFVFLTGPTNHLLNGLVQNVGGSYLNHFVAKVLMCIYTIHKRSWLGS